MYQTGKNVTQDYKEAVKWYRMAAEQGDAQAQNSLGVMYANGEGVIQDYKEEAPHSNSIDDLLKLFFWLEAQL